jgi:hypothetical protein
MAGRTGGPGLPGRAPRNCPGETRTPGAWGRARRSPGDGSNGAWDGTSPRRDLGWSPDGAGPGTEPRRTVSLGRPPIGPAAVRFGGEAHRGVRADPIRGLEPEAQRNLAGSWRSPREAWGGTSDGAWGGISDGAWGGISDGAWEGISGRAWMDPSGAWGGTIPRRGPGRGPGGACAWDTRPPGPSQRGSGAEPTGVRGRSPRGAGRPGKERPAQLSEPVQPSGANPRHALTANSPGTGMAPACLRVRVHEYEGRGVPGAVRHGALGVPRPQQKT